MAKVGTTIHLDLSEPEAFALKKFLGNFSEVEKQAKGLTEDQGYLLSEIWNVLPDEPEID